MTEDTDGPVPPKHSLTVILGIPGSGKSTYSKSLVPTEYLNTVRINLDDLRLMFGVRFKEELEEDIWWLTIIMADHLLATKRNVVIDESITNPEYMKRLKALASRHGVALNGVWVDSPSYLCWKKREGTDFPREAFERKFAEWELHRKAILCLCDNVEVVDGNRELLERMCLTVTTGA